MSANNSRLEVEVKFLLTALNGVQESLLNAGAVLKKPRVYERNVRLDTHDEALLQRWELLRVRQDTAVRVTFKGLAVEDLTSEAKVREELEITVDDFDTAVTLFTRLGFKPVQIYEKYRTTFQLSGVEIVLDEMPFGNFVELEGTEAAIKETAVTLGLDWEKRVLGNYLALMGELKAHHNLPFSDLTFENFRDRPVSIEDVLPGKQQ